MLLPNLLALLASGCLETATVVDFEDGRPLYREERRRPDCLQRSGTETVRYLRPSGELFAEKTIVLTTGTLPDVRMHQTVPVREIKVRVKDDTAIVTVAAQGATRTSHVRLPAGAVLDAGIDVWIAAHLEEIASGKRLVVPVLLPEFGRVVDFEASRAEGGAVGELRVALSPRNRLLRLLADRLVATYDRATGRLVAYEGISDVKDPNGRNYRVRLRFQSTPSIGVRKPAAS